MPTATEHAERVLGAIIPDRRDLLDEALQRLTYDVFQEQIHLNLFKLLERYGDVTQGVLSRDALEDLISGNADPGRVELYLETYDQLAEMHVDPTDFAWSIEQLKELAAEKATKDVIADAMEIVGRGKDIGRGQILQGHEDARNYALEKFSQIDRDLTLTEAPEGDIRKERQDFLAEYAATKERRIQGKQEGIKFGVLELDNIIGGVQRGELGLIVAYTSDGKTSLAAQMAWHAAVKQGKNVVFFSTETVKNVVRRKIVARHSCEPQFNMPDGINTQDIKNGTLSDVQELRLQEVVLDLETNPAYGHIYIVQVPREASITTIEHRLARLQRQFPIDLVVIDYLAQFRAAEKIDSYRDRLTSILKDAKRMAVTFNNGQGVAMISPWQINREWFDRATTLGMYNKSALAETSEAERTPDIIVSLLGPADDTSPLRELKGQILKARDGETSNSLRIIADYRTSKFSSKESGNLAAAMAGHGTREGGLDSLLG